eukprot:jgi/Galph1/5857/GphlegSOOS_G4467.1
MTLLNTNIYLKGEKTFSFAVDVHPVVLLNIADHQMRRSERQHRVIGTLLGRVNVDGTVEITESFPVPHSETAEEVAVDIDYHRTMYELTRRVSTDEVIGWYATGGAPDENSVLIHEFYCRECTPGLVPVHLLLDAEQKNDLETKAYISCVRKIGDQPISTEFRQVELRIISGVSEAVGYEGLLQAVRHEEKKNLRSVSAEFDNLQSSLQKLLLLLEKVESYVKQVTSGKKRGDIAVGRYLSDTLSMIPHLDGSHFQKLFSDNLRDLLMILYLDKLTWANVMLAEKLLTVNFDSSSL